MLRYILYLVIVFAITFVLYELFYRICELIGKYDKKVNDAAEQIRQEHQKKIETEKQKVINKQSQKASSTVSYNNNNSQNTINNQNSSQGQKSGNNTNIPPKNPKKEEKKIPDCLTVLGFIKEPENSEEIRARYKKLIRIYHPDEGGTDEEFQRVNKAYEEAKKLYHID